MTRNYPLPAASPRRGPGRQAARLAALLLAGGAVAGLAGLQGHAARGQNLFAAQTLQENRFAILGRPVGREDWNLLVLEQLAGTPRCWTERPDGLIDPSLNRFNFTGICSRYIDSNGYSLRVGEQDLATTYRLRLVQVGEELRLLASTVSNPTDLLVGRGRVPLRDRDGFVLLALEPGWSLQRRVYQGRSLSHLYFANSDSLPVLLARLQPPPPAVAAAPLGRGSTLLSRVGSVGSPAAAGGSGAGVFGEGSGTYLPGRPVPLQVIPFRD